MYMYTAAAILNACNKLVMINQITIANYKDIYSIMNYKNDNY